MKTNEGGGNAAMIYASAAMICAVIMCFQVNGSKNYANAENISISSVIYANAEDSEPLSLKEKLAEDESVWGSFARALEDMISRWHR